MIKAAIEKIQSLCAPTIREIEGSHFVITPDGSYTEIHKDLWYPETITLTSLESLVTMVKEEAAERGHRIFISIPSHLRVQTFCCPDSDLRYHFVPNAD